MCVCVSVNECVYSCTRVRASVCFSVCVKDSLWISQPAVSEVVGVGGQRAVGFTEVVFGVAVVVSTKTTQLVLVATHTDRRNMSEASTND